MACPSVGKNIVKMSQVIKVNDEGGFVLIATLVSLLLLIILGISTTTTTNIELQIAGNDKVNTTNSYVAEGTAYEAAQLLENGTAVIGVSTAGSGNGSSYFIVDKGIARGSSLNMTKSQVHIYDITGSAANNNSSDSITIGFKKRF